MDKNKKKYFIAGIIGLAAVALIWLAGSDPKPPIDVNPNDLPGIQTGNYPWPPEADNLKNRLNVIGLPALPKEGAAFHIHAHLDIFIGGKSVSVPAEIGVNEKAGFISPVHTHKLDAIIHVESPTVQAFTLGQFFDIWGVRFTDQCLGGYCNSGDKILRVYANGNLMIGDLREIVLAERQEIVVVYGTNGELPNPIPSSFSFPPNL